MPQIAVSSVNIDIFRFAVYFDIYQRKVVFNTSGTAYNGSSGSGVFNVLGISFLLQDQDGVTLASIDFTDASKFIVPGTTQEFEVDMSSISIPFFFQTYKIQGAIKDADGTIYYTTPAYKKVCQPVNLTESGYVPGVFQVSANCADNLLTIKELTNLTYNGSTYDSVEKSGTLSYPTGTISAVSFTGTPFSNNVIYTGEYRVVCTTIATYDLEDDVYVLVTYSTNNVFNITCANKIADLMCCMVDLQTTYLRNCNNAIGKNAQQKLNEVTMPFLIGLTKEINGQDASTEADLIKKTLNCDCGASSIRQNEFTPINPSVTNIVLTGGGGVTIGDPTTVGNTKTYVISSNSIQIVKGNTGDLAYTIALDTSTSGVVKYKITFDYAVMASYILSAIGASSTLTAALNALIQDAGLSLAGLDGKCILDLGACDYVYSNSNPDGDWQIMDISIDDVVYNAPADMFLVNGATPISNWLNGLGLGSFSVVVNIGSPNNFLIQSLANENAVQYITVNAGAVDNRFSFIANCQDLKAILQGIIDYLCELTALKVALGEALTLYTIDYNGNILSQGFTATDLQSTFNSSLANSIYSIIQRIDTLTGITCAKLAAVYVDRASSVFSGSLARVHGIDNEGNCVAFTREQLAKGIMNAVNDYAAVKTIFCAVDCEEPATCPEISNISLAMNGSSIGIYGVSFATTPIASQTVIVQYKLSSSSTWLTATSSLQILPNGMISGTTPFSISGVTAGQTYDIKIVNNCGGEGFVKQITTPTGTVYSGSYLLDTILYNICGNSPVTLYSSAPFAAGIILYSNAGLTVPVTGYGFVADNAEGSIYTMDTGTGEVLADTGTNCSNGTPKEVLLGNDSGVICNTIQLTRYLNGTTLIGAVLYVDAALSTPQTGYSYVVDLTDGSIYTLNSSTGVIGYLGLKCGVYGASFGLGNTELAACGAGNTTLYSDEYYGVGVTMYTDAGLTTPVTGYSFLRDATGIGYNLDSTTGIITSLTGNSC
jgi:hypothetical protein